MSVSGIFYLAVLALAFGAGNILLSSLGSETIPSALVPLADRWRKAGRDHKWIRRSMWILFTVCALLFVGLIFYLVYPSVLQLGQKWPGSSDY